MKLKSILSCCTLSWRSFCFRCVVVDPYFTHCHIPTQKIHFTSLEQLQTALWIIEALLFLIGCECDTLPSDIFKVSAISRNFNLRSSKTILWTFVMIYGTTADFGRPERSASSVFVQPRLNFFPFKSNVLLTLETLCYPLFWKWQKLLIITRRK